MIQERSLLSADVLQMQLNEDLGRHPAIIETRELSLRLMFAWL
jgi:hypothetical protein